tara:strand:- start:479 stop:943 length:465 start_codon:yes stop_codon:yes gene_type:complete
MFFLAKHRKYLFFILLIFFLTGCQIQEQVNNHGILFLENRSKKLIVNKSNINDVLQIMGSPQITSISNKKTWFYIERTLSKGKFHKLGQNVLKKNNVLVLEFNKFGILENKILLDKEDRKKLAFSKNITTNEITQKSFIEKFLSSVREKMYSNR